MSKRRVRERDEFSRNPAKARHDDYVRQKRRKRKRRRKKRTGRTFGVILSVLQLLASVVLMVMLGILGMIPFKYMILAGFILLLLFLITFINQMRARKKGVLGKIFSVFLTLVLVFGIYYIGKTNNMVDLISSGSTDTMVVAVKKSDSANKLKDAGGYNFGVQYALSGDDVENMVSAINDEIGGDIQTTECDGLKEEAEKLFDDEVDAIIYNKKQTGILENVRDGYSDQVKVIYEYDLKDASNSKAHNVTVQTQPFTVYISGIDVYGEITQESRSDVNIIATVNPKTHQVLLVTTPRDYYVPIPGVSNGEKDKLTHAGLYGVDVSMATLEEIYKTKVEFYVRVNFTSLEDIVDKLGGVDVNSELEFNTGRESGKVMHVDKGMNHFSGKEALAFSRERHNLPDGDNQRGKNQQAVITAMIDKIIAPDILVKASGIMDSVSGNVETNMSDKQIQSLIKQQLNDGGAWNVCSVAAGGVAQKMYCYSYPDKPLYVTVPDEESVSMIEEMINAVEAGEKLDESVVADGD